MRRQYVLALGIALAAATGWSSAQAAKLPHALEKVPAFEVAEGRVAARALAPIYDRAPSVAEPQWDAFVHAASGEWRAMWNPKTGVPQRIFGSGIPAPGAVQSASSAEAHAREALRDHLELIAPGAEVSDFELAANHLDDTGMRTVSFFQHHGGIRVLGGQVSFRFRNDRLFVIGSEALPNVQVPPRAARVASRTARERARGWVEERGETTSDVTDPRGPYILPIVRAPGQIDYHTVDAVRVTSASMPALWEVYVDSASGDPVARRQLLAFAGGHIGFDVPARRPGGERTTLPGSFLQLSIEGLERFTDVVGYFTWGSGRRDVRFFLRGPFVRVVNESGVDETFEREFRDGDDAVFGEPDDEFLDAQVALFAHVNYVKEYVRHISYDAWLDEQMIVNANISGDFFGNPAVCNAFFRPGFPGDEEDTGTINFFVEGSIEATIEGPDGEPVDIEIACNNTGRLADVIYHEFGHAVHMNSIIPGVGEFDGSLSEGVSDYLAATITGDPGMGRGFFLFDSRDESVGPEDPLRHLDPESEGGRRLVYPDDRRFLDNGQEDVHFNGQIIGATLWHLREELIAKHGEQEGIAQADRIWLGILQRASDMPSAYVEALAADDDDGDLTNGTPNSCIINRAFGAGGLGDGDGVVVPGLEPPLRDGFDLTLPVTTPDGCEPIDIGSVRVHWELRDGSGGGTLQMERGTNGYELRLPEQEEDTVMEYQVEVVFENGSNFVYPNNPADPYYHVFVGEPQEVYCTSFDADPFDEDDDDHWTTDVELGEESWEWGEPQTRGLGGAPTQAYSGDNVLATDIGENSYGLYPPNSRSWVQSPELDLYGWDDARLQFRRWLAVDSSDRARIYVNDRVVWDSADHTSDDGEGNAVSLRDREWVFQDIDLSQFLGDTSVQVRFEIESDDERELAGWAIDDFCVVSYVEDPECPDFDRGETCDGPCPPYCDPDERQPADGSSGGCGCSAGAHSGFEAGSALLGLGLLAALALLRRRRHA